MKQHQKHLWKYSCMFKEYIFPLESGCKNMLGTCIDLQCNILPYVKKSIKNIFFNHVDQMSYISIFFKWDTYTYRH